MGYDHAAFQIAAAKAAIQFRLHSTHLLAGIAEIGSLVATPNHMNILKRIFGSGGSTWTEIPGVTISIPGRGEEIYYEEGGQRYCFEIFLGRQPLQLFAGRYWTGSLPVVFYELNEAEKQRIIPRLVSYLGSHGEKVEVVWKE